MSLSPASSSSQQRGPKFGVMFAHDYLFFLGQKMGEEEKLSDSLFAFFCWVTSTRSRSLSALIRLLWHTFQLSMSAANWLIFEWDYISITEQISYEFSPCSYIILLWIFRGGKGINLVIVWLLEQWIVKSPYVANIDLEERWILLKPAQSFWWSLVFDHVRSRSLLSIHLLIWQRYIWGSISS